MTLKSQESHSHADMPKIEEHARFSDTHQIKLPL